MLHFDAFANKLLSNVRLKDFNAYVHIDVVVKSSELSSMHEDVKFKFISLLGVTVKNLDMKMMYLKALIKAYAMNHNKMLRDAWNVPIAIYHICKE
jgi:hypothetical protein